jgi:hypothetical protein
MLSHAIPAASWNSVTDGASGCGCFPPTAPGTPRVSRAAPRNSAESTRCDVRQRVISDRHIGALMRPEVEEAVVGGSPGPVSPAAAERSSAFSRSAGSVMPVSRRYFAPGQLQFITSSVYRRLKLFESHRLRRDFGEVLRQSHRSEQNPVAGGRCFEYNLPLPFTRTWAGGQRPLSQRQGQYSWCRTRVAVPT